MHRDRAPHTRGRRLARRPSLYPVRPPCDSAGRTLPLRRQQAAHPLRVGGHPGLRLRLRWLWLELGEPGKLRLKPSPRCACGRGRVHGGCLSTTARNTCAWRPHLHRRESRATKTNEHSGCGCRTSARECRTSTCVCCADRDVLQESAPATRAGGGAHESKDERHTAPSTPHEVCDVLIRLWSIDHRLRVAS